MGDSPSVPPSAVHPRPFHNLPPFVLSLQHRKPRRRQHRRTKHTNSDTRHTSTSITITSVIRIDILHLKLPYNRRVSPLYFGCQSPTVARSRGKLHYLSLFYSVLCRHMGSAIGRTEGSLLLAGGQLHIRTICLASPIMSAGTRVLRSVLGMCEGMTFLRRPWHGHRRETKTPWAWLAVRLSLVPYSSSCLSLSLYLRLFPRSAHVLSLPRTIHIQGISC